MVSTAKNVLRNFISLSLGEIIAKVLGLITFAYLARVLTPDGFGLIGFSTTFVSYFVLIVNFGFDTYGVREISRNPNKFENIVNSIFTIRIILAIVSLIFLIVSSLLIGKGVLIRLALILGGINILTTAFSMDWFYLGIQKMQLVAFRQIGTSILNLFLVILFVRGSDDLLLAVFFSGISALINSLLILRSYQKYYKRISPTFSFGILKHIFIESAPIALSSLMIAVYYNMDIVMLGFMRSNEETGYYSAAVKVMLAMAILNNYMRSIFPILSNLWESNVELFKMYLNNLINLVWIFAFSFISLAFFSKHIVLSVYGASYLPAISTTTILIINQCIIWFFSPFALPLISISKQKYFLFSITSGAITNIILNFILIPRYGIEGAAIATLISEVIVGSIQLLIFVRTIKLKLIKLMKTPIVFLFVISVTSIASSYIIKNIFVTVGINILTFLLLSQKYDLKKQVTFLLNKL